MARTGGIEPAGRNVPALTTHHADIGIEPAASAWEDVRVELGFTEAEELEISRRTERMPAEVRAHRLAEIRKSHGLTQKHLAEILDISHERVSQIERSGLDSTVLSTLSAYVEALGGHVRVVADFGEQQLLLG
ncbi:MAG TPA: helix-turn-helix transcriptional regulator [Actinocrinis sp.]|nr:helix-turn-helix transcriptional regulator [Actinocrinis sp.]